MQKSSVFSSYYYLTINPRRLGTGHCAFVYKIRLSKTKEKGRKQIMNSPYASPNSPIASSKRARVNSAAKTVEGTNNNLKSPLKSQSSSKTFIREKDYLNNENISDKKVALFSPALRYDEYDHVCIDKNTTSNDEIRVDTQSVTEKKSDSEDEEEQFNPYQFIAGLPPHDSVYIADKICLPPPLKSQKCLTLALDLDETLVHCTLDPIEKYDISFPVTFNGVFYHVYVRKRPYLDYFLETVSKLFEVVVFTASQKVYADVLLDLLDPEKKYISHRLFREACLLVQGNYLKDLHVLGRDLTKTVLVDNSPHAYGFQIDNGIPIESWFDDDKDTELLKVVKFLRDVQFVDDVRPVVHDHFKTYELVRNAKMNSSPSLLKP